MLIILDVRLKKNYLYLLIKINIKINNYKNYLSKQKDHLNIKVVPFYIFKDKSDLMPLYLNILLNFCFNLKLISHKFKILSNNITYIFFITVFIYIRSHSKSSTYTYKISLMQVFKNNLSFLPQKETGIKSAFLSPSGSL